MREKIIKKLKTPQGTAFISALICGIATHLFPLTNIIHNQDSMCVMPCGYGTSTTSGRWALDILGRIASHFRCAYNVPAVNNFVFLLSLAFSAALIVTVLKLRRRISAALCGALFVVFPNAVTTMYYSFTTQFYGIGVFLAVFSSWILVETFSTSRNNTAHIAHRSTMYAGGVILSGCAMSVSLGIYQAYFPLGASLLVLSLLGDCLRGEDSFAVVMRRALCYLAGLALGMVLYFVFLKLALALTNLTLSGYQGINNMGHISLEQLPLISKNVLYTFSCLLFGNIYSLIPTGLMNIIYFLLVVFSLIGLVLILYRCAQTKKSGRGLLIALAVVLCCIFPFAVGLIHFMCPNGSVATLMIYSYVTVIFAPVVVIEALPEASGKAFTIAAVALRKGTALLLALLGLLYIYYDELNYTAEYYATVQMENYTTALITQIRMTEGFSSEKQWVFINNELDPLLNNPWSYAPLYDATFTYLHDTYSRHNWIRAYFAYAPRIAADDEVDAILERTDIHDELVEMPVFPDYGSIKVIEDMVVIKMGEIE